MKIITKTVFLSLIVLSGGISAAAGVSKTENPYMDGDIIFHKSRSSQAVALEKATGSPYTHVGIIFNYNGRPYVIEAVQPVQKIPLVSFIKRGLRGEYVIKRLDSRVSISDEKITLLKKNAEAYIGKNYDFLFQWSDERIYCSELVWKAYNHTLGVKLGKLQKLKEFDLSSREVQQLIRVRGAKRLSMEEEIISPVSLMNDTRLITVESK